jgi:ComF family protein
MSDFLASLWRDKFDVIFPRGCVHCGGVVDGGEFRYLCAPCAKLLHIVAAPHCTTCGHPFFGEMSEGRRCEHCEALVPRFGQGKTAVLLQGAGRSIVHALKYHGGLYVLEDIAAIMRRTPGYADYVRGSVLVPVPLHPEKEEKRQYNQSRLLAECVMAAANGHATIEPLLQRVVNTISQTHYDREARQENLKNAFALVPGATLNPGLRYILVDDVFTTGSTLNSCAAVLRRGGALSLDVVTFGHG